MAKLQRLEVRHTIVFYAVMVVIGALAAGLALYFGITAPKTDAEGRPTNAVMLWLLIGFSVLAMSLYVRRGVVRILDRRPVIVIDKPGIQLRIDKVLDIPWDRIHKVTLSGLSFRPRLELQVDAEIHDPLNLPTWIFDDNFVSVRNKPHTIGIWSQGLDRPMREVLECINAWRPNLLKRR